MASVAGPTSLGPCWLPAPAVVVLANDVFAVTGYPGCAVVAVTAVLARLIAVSPRWSADSSPSVLTARRRAQLSGVAVAALPSSIWSVQALPDEQSFSVA
jgi:hypothetical protein